MTARNTLSLAALRTGRLSTWRLRAASTRDTALTLPYLAPTFRRGWLDLPSPERTEIDRRLGQPVDAAMAARAGHNNGFAALLTHVDGSQSFCKAAPSSSRAGIRYAREAAIVALLPSGVPAARLRWRSEVAGWFVAAYDAVGAASLEPSWSSALRPVLAALADTAHAFAHASAPLRAAARPSGPLAAGWADVVAGSRPLPRQAVHLRRFAASMADLEAQFLAAADIIHRLAHFGVRADNLVKTGGRIRLVNWAALRPVPADVDLVMLAVDAAEDGADPQPVFDRANPAMTHAEFDQTLAWLSGAWLTGAGDAAGERLRDGLCAWQWFARRHRLPTAPVFPARGRNR